MCEFNLTVNYLQTFASYSLRDDGSIDPLDGYVYNIDTNGQVIIMHVYTKNYTHCNAYMIRVLSCDNYYND